MNYIHTLLTACIKKKKIKTLEYAKKISKKYNQYYYFCPICSHYHLTKNRKDEKGIIKKEKEE